MMRLLQQNRPQEADPPTSFILGRFRPITWFSLFVVFTASHQVFLSYHRIGLFFADIHSLTGLNAGQNGSSSTLLWQEPNGTIPMASMQTSDAGQSGSSSSTLLWQEPNDTIPMASMQTSDIGLIPFVVNHTSTDSAPLSRQVRAETIKVDSPRKPPVCPLPKGKWTTFELNSTNSSVESSAFVLPPDIQQIKTVFCTIDHGNTQTYWINHFPHAAQWTMPCWSFFQRVRERFPNANVGLWMNSFQAPRPNFMKLWKHPWIGEVIESMNVCKILNSEPSLRNLSSSFAFYAEDQALVYRPRPAKSWRSPTWFGLAQDAHELRDRVLQGHPTSWMKEVNLLSDDLELRIGLAQRVNNRRVTNMEEIQVELTKAFPNAMSIEIKVMENMTFYEQAVWWNRQTVVVAPHGAALTNIMFMAHKAAVVEIFPPHFYELDYFRTLSESVGVRHYQWMDPLVKDYEADYQAHNNERKFKLRDVSPPVKAIIGLVKKALQKDKLR